MSVLKPFEIYWYPLTTKNFLKYALKCQSKFNMVTKTKPDIWYDIKYAFLNNLDNRFGSCPQDQCFSNSSEHQNHLESLGNSDSWAAPQSLLFRRSGQGVWVWTSQVRRMLWCEDHGQRAGALEVCPFFSPPYFWEEHGLWGLDPELISAFLWPGDVINWGNRAQDSWVWTVWPHKQVAIRDLPPGWMTGTWQFPYSP